MRCGGGSLLQVERLLLRVQVPFSVSVSVQHTCATIFIIQYKSFAFVIMAEPDLMVVAAWYLTAALSSSEGPFPWHETK